MRVIVETVDANLAGTEESSQCVLYIHDNLYIPEDLIKPNCGFIRIDPMLWYDLENMDMLDLEDHVDINRIVRLLNLTLGVNYNNQNNYRTLRYGSIKIECRDQITREILLWWFEYFYPTIIPRIMMGNLLNIQIPNIVLVD